MKQSSRSYLSLAFFGLMSIAATPNALAQFKCDQPLLNRVDATACALGNRDVASLRRYVTRTQAIYGLQMKDYVRFEGDEPTASRASAAQAAPRDSVAGFAAPVMKVDATSR